MFLSCLCALLYEILSTPGIVRKAISVPLYVKLKKLTNNSVQSKKQELVLRISDDNSDMLL